MSAPSATVMDHVLSPRNGGEMQKPTAIGRASLGGRAPYVTIYLKVDRGAVSNAMFQTFGCGYSIACCSILTEIVTKLTAAECRLVTSDQIISSLGGLPAERTFCAELAVAALRNALNQLKDNP